MDMNVYLLQKIEELDAINSMQHQLLQPMKQSLYYQNGVSRRPSRQNSVHETPATKIPISFLRSRHGSDAGSQACPQAKVLASNLNPKSNSN